jgi:capsid protein
MKKRSYEGLASQLSPLYSAIRARTNGSHGDFVNQATAAGK